MEMALFGVEGSGAALSGVNGAVIMAVVADWSCRRSSVDWVGRLSCRIDGVGIGYWEDWGAARFGR